MTGPSAIAAQPPPATQNWVDAPPGRALLVGLGSGVQAAGDAMCDAGWTLAAADRDRRQAAEWADRHGVAVVADDAIGTLDGVDLVVTSAAIPASHAVRRLAAARGVRCLDYPDWLGEWTRRRRTIAVAGTHGKSTAVALLHALLPDAGLCGGAAPLGQPNGRFGNDRLVVEACEYRVHFLKLAADVACVLNVEHDHPDAFANEAATVAAFAEFAASCPPQGTLVLAADVAGRLPCDAAPTIVTFAVAGDRDATTDCAADVKLIPDATADDRFTLRTAAGEQRLTVPNLAPPLWPSLAAACAVAFVEGVSPGDIAARLRRFPGLPRRFERRPAGPVQWIADYAHHPTAIAATLAHARTLAGGGDLVAIFEPHQLGRLTAFFDRFVDALAIADEVWVMPVFAARETTGRVDRDAAVGRLAAELRRRLRAPSAVVAADDGQLDRFTADLHTRLASDPTPAAVVLLGAGRIHDFELEQVRQRLDRAA